MENIMEFLNGRRTYRRFKQTPVPESTVKNIIEAARCANCGGNRQALKYVVAQKPEDVKASFGCTLSFCNRAISTCALL